MKKLVMLLMCALMLVTVSVGAQQTPGVVAPRVFSMATLAPEGSTFMRVFNSANRELRRRTNNALSLRWYAGGVQGDEAEVIRKIRSGRLDGAAVTAVGLAQIHRPILAFQMPAMFDTAEQMNRARDALAPDLDAAFNTAGFKLLGFASTGGPRMFSTHAIRVPNDLHSAHPWVWRDDLILPALYTEAGATGVSLQVPEVLGAIQTNRVDTFIASPLIAVALQWATHMHFMSARSNTASIGALIVSRAAYESVPADQRAIVQDVFREFNTLLGHNVTRDDTAAGTQLQTRGIETVTLTPAEQAQWTQLFTRVRARLAGQVGDRAWIARVEAAGRGH